MNEEGFSPADVKDVKVSIEAISDTLNENRKEIIITLIAKEDLRIKNIPELRRKKLRRFLKEARRQKATIPVEILSQLLCASTSSVWRILRETGLNKYYKKETYVETFKNRKFFKKYPEFYKIFKMLTDIYYSDIKFTFYGISALNNILYLLGDEEATKPSRSALYRMIKTFWGKGIFLTLPTKVSRRKALLTAADYFNVHDKKTLIEHFEKYYKKIKHKFPVSAYLAAMLINRKKVLKIDEVARAFAVPIDMVERAYFEIYSYSHNQKRANKKKL